MNESLSCLVCHISIQPARKNPPGKRKYCSDKCRAIARRARVAVEVEAMIRETVRLAVGGRK
jgi:hypothetical protein